MSQKSSSDDMLRPHWDPAQPYQDLPLLPPDAELESVRVLKACIQARASLGELKQAIALIPNPRVLLSSLPLLEAQASSEVENIVTTADELFRHLDTSGNATPAAREALRYREALMEGYRALERRPLGVGIAQEICTRIKATQMSPRKVPGTAIANAGTGAIIYTPPNGVERLLELLSNWERFLHGSDPLDPLVRMAVAHYQFEAIHPFGDGNGRTGRILNSLFLVERELLGAPILYLSRYIIQNKEAYYRLLLGVTKDREWEPWILYMLNAVAETSAWTVDKVRAIRQLMAETKEHVQSALPKLYSAELVEKLFELPYCRIPHLVAAEIVQRQAASRYLKQLASIGILEEQRHGREKLFVNTRLLSLLSAEGNLYPPLTYREGEGRESDRIPAS